MPDRRGTRRYATTLPVSLRKSGQAPYASSLINISTTGAAITLYGWEAGEAGLWPNRLKHGDEIALTGLLDVPLRAWVLASDQGVLRVRFPVDDTVRAKLHAVITKLAAAA